MNSDTVDHTNHELDREFLRYLEFTWTNRPWPDAHAPLRSWHTHTLNNYRREYNETHSDKVTPYHAIRCLRTLANSVVTLDNTDNTQGELEYERDRRAI